MQAYKSSYVALLGMLFSDCQLKCANVSIIMSIDDLRWNYLVAVRRMYACCFVE